MKKKALSYAMGPQRWANVLSRWSDAPDCGEKKFMVWALGHWIAEGAQEEPPFRGAFWEKGGNFGAYCKVIHLDPVFVMEQVERARHKEMGPHQPCYFEESGKADREAMNG